MKKMIFLFWVQVSFFVAFVQQPSTPDEIYGDFFRQVQMKRIFPDGKTFIDCIPKRDPKSIMKDYHTSLKNDLTLDLKKFVYDNFELPGNPATNYQTDTTEDIVAHIKKLWKILYRPADSVVSTNTSSPPAGGGGRTEKMTNTLKTNLLKPGGIATSIYNTGQRWDAPNGWPPLQWMTIGALEKVGEKELAKEIAQRWIKLNIRVYKETGKLMEKYDVVDICRLAGGGEYPSQDGFGWTNGVLLKLIAMYGMPDQALRKDSKSFQSGSQLNIAMRVINPYLQFHP